METIEQGSRNTTSFTPDERNWAMYCHLAVFGGFLIPFGNLIGPLVIWLLRKERYAFVDYHGKEVLNFQITLLIALIISGILTLVLIGFLLLPALLIAALVLTIIGTVKTANGEYYRYPFSIRFVK
ncbi:MAG TPA: DUF4870 domain-containing protein [Gammaproteobacteria bacterium]